MRAIITCFFIAILATVIHGAAIVPIDTAIVKSDRIGNAFSYSIQENRGILAATLEPVQPLQRLSITNGQILQSIASKIDTPIDLQSSKLTPLQQTLPLQSLAYTSAALPLTYGTSFGYIPAGQYAYTYPYAYPIAYNLVKS